MQRLQSIATLAGCSSDQNKRLGYLQQFGAEKFASMRLFMCERECLLTFGGRLIGERKKVERFIIEHRCRFGRQNMKKRFSKRKSFLPRRPLQMTTLSAWKTAASISSRQ